jgi:hypothetical protein
MHATCFFETSADFQQTTERYVPNIAKFTTPFMETGGFKSVSNFQCDLGVSI